MERMESNLRLLLHQRDLERLCQWRTSLWSLKLQMRLEQKLKMKLAKKLRLRRKRLLRKRRMRKNGRWPPSMMKKKLMNV
ncbi:hypothetical protein BHE74_00004904 [Ensete ventricosum]|nr:hypothetical protein GW17_00027326 [Ensete ventricosum]RWW86320.1 hypothetical protein BHE74_00004904 [Ensete ventricosum]